MTLDGFLHLFGPQDTHLEMKEPLFGHALHAALLALRAIQGCWGARSGAKRAALIWVAVYVSMFRIRQNLRLKTAPGTPGLGELYIGAQVRTAPVRAQSTLGC